MSRYRDRVLATSPVAYWRLGESSGTTAVDEMGSYHGTYVGSPTLGVAGAIQGDPDKAVTFATGKHVVLGAHTFHDFTLTAWVKPTASDANIVSFGSAGCVLSLAIDGATRRLHCFTKPDDGAYRDQLGHNNQLTVNEWAFLVMVRAGTVVDSYVNGAKDTVTSLSDAGALTATEGRIAAYFNQNGGFNNPIDEVAIFDRALTAAEVAALYRVGRSTWNRSGRPETDPTPTNAAKHARYG